MLMENGIKRSPEWIRKKDKLANYGGRSINAATRVKRVLDI